MKSIIVTIGLAFLALAAPATEARSGVSAEVRRACEMQAEKVRPALRAGEKEAWIANCLADATAKKGKTY
jgi:hypothetical protein